MDAIQFNNRHYKIRDIYIPAYGYRIVASTMLSNKLMNEEGSNYVSDEARHVDERIFFYISPTQFGLSDKKLRKVISESL